MLFSFSFRALKTEFFFWEAKRFGIVGNEGVFSGGGVKSKFRKTLERKIKNISRRKI